jgi:hypothetical protein
MEDVMSLFRNWELVLGLAVLGCLLPAAAAAQPDTNCLPSCAVNDGRFLVITDGQGLDTLTDEQLDLQVRSPANLPSFELQIFDGETSGSGGTWDLNTGGFDASLIFELLPDADEDGVPDDLTPLITIDGETQTLDDAWVSFTIPNVAAALIGDGTHYSYVLQASLQGDLQPAIRSSFKVQTDGEVSIQVTQQPFAFAASMPSPKEFAIIYPDCLSDFSNFPGCLGGGTTFDGTFSFFLEVPGAMGSGQVAQIEIWDGDLDHGDWNGDNNDTDDPNTPSNAVAGDLPPWAFLCTEPGLQPGDEGCTAPCAQGPGDPEPAEGDLCIERIVRFEGVAQGVAPSTGNPPDDFDPAGIGSIFVRSPALGYEVILRERFDGQTDGLDEVIATNTDPSGNREWEVFCLSQGSALCDITLFDPSDPAVPTQRTVSSDTQVAELPSGIYEVRVMGLDLENLNAFRFDAELVPDPEYNVGDFVYLDLNGDGMEQAGEPGIPGVLVNLWDALQQGPVQQTALTDANGMYLFQGLAPGEYLVEVAPENFAPGGALEGLATSLSPQQLIITVDGGDGLDGPERQVPGFAVDPVGSGDVLTFDFPYVCPCDLECGCEGKVTSLTLRYTGLLTNAQVVVEQKKDGAIVFNDIVQMNEDFSFDGTWKKGTLGTEIRVYVNGDLNTQIHTSCSQPIGPGLEFGDFLVVEGTSREGGELCPLGQDDGATGGGSDSDGEGGRACHSDGVIVTDGQ